MKLFGTTPPAEVELRGRPLKAHFSYYTVLFLCHEIKMEISHFEKSIDSGKKKKMPAVEGVFHRIGAAFTEVVEIIPFSTVIAVGIRQQKEGKA